jgi:hypothetical protein
VILIPILLDHNLFVLKLGQKTDATEIIWGLLTRVAITLLDYLLYSSTCKRIVS